MHQIMHSAIIHTIWCIWLERNNMYFNGKCSYISHLINIIISEVKLSFTLVLTTGPAAMSDLKISLLFGIPMKLKRVTPAREICWTPSEEGCIKINCDGSTFENPSNGSIGFVIRNYKAEFMGAMTQNIGYASPLEAEFGACMLAMEKARELLFTNLWIETDSTVVVKAFTTMEGIPWRLFTRWSNCMKLCQLIRCRCSYVPRIGNLVADALAKNGQGLAFSSFQWWNNPPPPILPYLHQDNIGLRFHVPI